MTVSEATVLVVDDEPILRTTFAALLGQLGCAVHTAANGVEALEVMARERIDVILTDRHMPKMDGLAFLETLHKRGETVPSIFFGDSFEVESQRRWKRLGVVEVLMKPLHPVRLKRVIEEVLLALPCVS